MNKPFQLHTCYRIAKGSKIPVYCRVCPKPSYPSYLKKGMLPCLQGTIKLKAVSRLFGRMPRLQGCSARAERPICRHISATLLTLHPSVSRFISEIFILFHGVYFCFCVNTYNLKSRKLIPPVIIFFLKTALAILDLLCFHMNCEIFGSSSLKNAVDDWIEIALNL